MTSLTLYEIAAEYRALVARLMEYQDDAQAIEDTLAGEAYPLEIKAQNVAYAIKTLTANAAAIKAAENEMYERRKAMENRAARIKDYLLMCMELAGVSQISCPHFAIRVANNPASVVIEDEHDIPFEFMRTPEPPPPAPDKAAIKDALKAGLTVPGARLAFGKRIDIR